MAAPSPIVRVAPSGFRLDEGYQALITVGTLPGIDLWEKDVGVPGIDGGDPIDTTTQHNSIYNTKSPRVLKELTPFTVVCAYDPCVFTDILGLVNGNDSITITFPDTTTLAFWGYIRSAEFAPMVIGEQPEVTITIVPTNYDPNNCVEAGPAIDCNGTC